MLAENFGSLYGRKVDIRLRPAARMYVMDIDDYKMFQPIIDKFNEHNNKWLYKFKEDIWTYFISECKEDVIDYGHRLYVKQKNTNDMLSKAYAYRIARKQLFESFCEYVDNYLIGWQEKNEGIKEVSSNVK